MLLVSSCRITRNIPDNEYLLNKTELNIENIDKKNGLREGELLRYIRQKPNKRVLGVRLHLRLFNLANPDKDKGISNFLRTIGEEPILLDTFQTQQSVANLKRYVESKGYYSSRVEENTTLGKRKAKVDYSVTLSEPYRIGKISYLVEDTLIRRIVLNDTINRLLKRGSRFDMDLLRDERIRIEKVLKEDGYFFFSRDFITFSADTTYGNRQVDLELVIRNRFIRNDFGERIPQTFRKYEISNVYVYTKYDPVEIFYLEEANLLDTSYYDDQVYIYDFEPGVRLKTISNANLIRPGQIYSESIVNKTRSNLNSLRLYRAVNIFFRPDEEAERKSQYEDEFVLFDENQQQPATRMGKLNCYIQLTPHTLQSYQVDLVGTNTASDVGVEGNLSYQHKNIFGGAEVFDTRFRGMVQFFTGERTFDNSIEFGGSVGFNFPRFLSPFASREFSRRYNPRTQITTSYNYQRRPDYTRTMAGLNFGYLWRTENRLMHNFSPVEVNLINLYRIDPAFLRRIEGTYLANSYISQLVTLTSYGVVYTDQSSVKTSYSVVRYNVETSGNILNGIYNLAGVVAEDGTYQLYGISFSQYVRSDITYVYNQRVDENNTFVYRIFMGAGLPYGNSKALPFEKKYFSGGSTGIRAWHARGLGPGSFVERELTIPNQTADIKLEANLEYRFNLVWMLEGAFFLDAGNIWAITSADDRPGSVFYYDQFYKQIALGSGAGIRMNLGFFTLRFDLGAKVYDPGIYRSSDDPEIILQNPLWIPFEKGYTRRDFVLHFGIGYPF